jgi:hypothetical protein
MIRAVDHIDLQHDRATAHDLIAAADRRARCIRFVFREGFVHELAGKVVQPDFCDDVIESIPLFFVLT